MNECSFAIATIEFLLGHVETSLKMFMKMRAVHILYFNEDLEGLATIDDNITLCNRSLKKTREKAK